MVVLLMLAIGLVDVPPRPYVAPDTIAWTQVAERSLFLVWGDGTGVAWNLDKERPEREFRVPDYNFATCSLFAMDAPDFQVAAMRDRDVRFLSAKSDKWSTVRLPASAIGDGFGTRGEAFVAHSEVENALFSVHPTTLTVTRMPWSGDPFAGFQYHPASKLSVTFGLRFVMARNESNGIVWRYDREGLEPVLHCRSEKILVAYDGETALGLSALSGRQVWSRKCRYADCLAVSPDGARQVFCVDDSVIVTDLPGTTETTLPLTLTATDIELAFVGNERVVALPKLNVARVNSEGAEFRRKSSMVEIVDLRTKQVRQVPVKKPAR